MKLTLFGCHSIEIKGIYTVEKEKKRPRRFRLGKDKEEAPRWTVTFKRLTFTWVDKGDLHDEKSTQLSEDLVIPDSFFKLIALMFPDSSSYDIRIGWRALSIWQYDGERYNRKLCFG